MIESREYQTDFLKKLIDNQVQFIVCGGVAAVLHGVERLTIDLDIALNMTDENLRNFLSVMKEQHMVPRAPVPPESILDRNLLKYFVENKGAVVFTFLDPDYPYKQIDFFLTADKSYPELIHDTVDITLEPGYTFKILTVSRLLAMKMSINSPRAKDLQDIAALKKLTGLNHV